MRAEPCDNNHVLNHLHMCVPANIYTQYTNEAYPAIPEDPGPWDGWGEETPLGRTQARSGWDVLNMVFLDTKNMNCALTNRFLSYLSAPMLQAFRNFYTQNSNVVFGRVFQWFLERYGQSNETERHENQTCMEADWSFDEGVKTLINQINTSLRYATYTRNAMSDRETVDTAILIVLRAGLFREAYAN